MANRTGKGQWQKGQSGNPNMGQEMWNVAHGSGVLAYGQPTVFGMPMISEYLQLYIEERVRQKRELGKGIVPAALAEEIAAELPNYRHLKKPIAAWVIKTAKALNCAEITGRFIKRRITSA